MKYWCLIAGILAVTILESVALFKGVNGLMLASALAIIGAMVGFSFGYFPQKSK